MKDTTIPYAVAVCGIIDKDARVYYSYEKSGTDAMIQAVKSYAMETVGQLGNYKDWLNEIPSGATVMDLINHFLQGDIAVSEPLQITE